MSFGGRGVGWILRECILAAPAKCQMLLNGLRIEPVYPKSGQSIFWICMRNGIFLKAGERRGVLCRYAG